ncbi:MAG: hypothetical protein K2M76_03145 [Muribaculaceae bacterium]|nr:hypothetical protein [Muribaculaceae bacterium]
MKANKYILNAVLALAGVSMFASCSEEELGPTIFPHVSTELDPTSYTYKFDTWLNQNFRTMYNVDFKYKLEDVEIDMQYNLIPATLLNSKELAALTKYLWFDAYGELDSPEFLKMYAPRILCLVGSSAHNPASGTETLGLAEGGLKITLFKVNEMQEHDMGQMNEYYFRTMHHEFAHILHQTKSYPVEFNTLTNRYYDPSNWQNKDWGQMASLGMITNYGSSAAREDFAETIANYVTRTDDQLEMILWFAGKGYSDGLPEGAEVDPTEEKTYYSYYLFKSEQDRLDQNPTYIYNVFDRATVSKGTLVDGEPYTPRDKNGNEVQVGILYKAGVYDPITDQYFTRVETAEAHLKELEERFGEVLAVADNDGIKGDEMILQKQSIARNWFKDVWNLDLDKLREIVQRRQYDYDLPALLAEIENIN